MSRPMTMMTVMTMVLDDPAIVMCFAATFEMQKSGPVLLGSGATAALGITIDGDAKLAFEAKSPFSDALRGCANSDF